MIKELTITATVFETSDNKQFRKQEDAIKHEKKLKAIEKISKYKFDGPKNIPYNPHMLIGYDYKWFNVMDKDELTIIIENLKIINKGYLPITMSIEELSSKIEFPSYIAVLYRGEAISNIELIDDIIMRYNYEMIGYKKFFEIFPNIGNKLLSSRYGLVKQLKFKDKENDEIHGGILTEDGDIICGCCGGIIRHDEMDGIEILEEYNEWVNIDEAIIGE